ncbi:MAG: nucleotidyltransferase domain-containing protein [Verrucomicrobia bacterium]|nr:nucleotidyltransferase domain-containing protein [Verrucomicrobiota bacterium]
MNLPPLTPHEIALMNGVFRRHPEVASATLFGSRAKGSHTSRSDVDLAVSGAVDPLRAVAIASELDELPLPYHFEVQSIDHITHLALLEHIRRVGILVYPEPAESK